MSKFAKSPLIALLDPEGTARFLDITPRQVEVLRRDPEFPKPVKLGPKSLRWKVSDLERYVASLPEAAPDPEPEQLAAARRARQAAAAAPAAPPRGRPPKLPKQPEPVPMQTPVKRRPGRPSKLATIATSVGAE
jgi:hypothetical protein